MADRVGFEPTHDFHRLLRFQRNLLNHLSTYPFYLAPPLGLEPRQTVLETVVLPITLRRYGWGLVSVQTPEITVYSIIGSHFRYQY